MQNQSSRSVLYKGVLTNFAKFAGKILCQSLFFKKERLWHECFPVNFVKFLRTPFLAEHFCWLLLIMNFLPVIHHQKRKLGTSTFWLMMWKMTKIHKKLLLTNFEKSLSIWFSWKIQQHSFFIRLHENSFFLLLETEDRVEKSCFYQNLWLLKK